METPSTEKTQHHVVADGIASHVESTNNEKHREGEVRTFDLADLGLGEQTPRDIKALDIIAIGWNICNSWLGVAATLALTIALGGSVTLIYGIIVCFIMVGCSGLTMAELASVYPTAGGQYHWTSILASPRYSRALSYICGTLNVYAWIATTAGIAIIVPQVVLAMVIANDPNYVPQTWHYFLLYQVVNVLVCVHNIFTLKKTLRMYDVAFALSLVGFFVVIITCLSRATTKQSNEFVWTQFSNESGWPSGVSFLTGLISPNYMYAGIDGAIHLAEECKRPERVVPWALISTLTIGFVTSFVFAVSMTYCIVDFDAVLGTPTGMPIYEIWRQATSSHVAAMVFMALLLIGAIVALTAVQQTASRLTWSLGRDNAFLLSTRFLSVVHPRLQVPVYALILNAIVVFIIGFIYLGSSTAFNAFIATGLILQQATYAIPAALLLVVRAHGRDGEGLQEVLPRHRPFKLPAVVGWAVNVMTVVFAIIVVVFYNFPVAIPVTGSSMNYTSAVLGVMALFAAINWFMHARNSYHGPRIHE